MYKYQNSNIVLCAITIEFYTTFCLLVKIFHGEFCREVSCYFDTKFVFFFFTIFCSLKEMMYDSELSEISIYEIDLVQDDFSTKDIHYIGQANGRNNDDHGGCLIGII